MTIVTCMTSRSAVLRDIADLGLNPRKAHTVGADGRLKKQTSISVEESVSDKITETEPVVLTKPTDVSDEIPETKTSNENSTEASEATKKGAEKKNDAPVVDQPASASDDKPVKKNKRAKETSAE